MMEVLMKEMDPWDLWGFMKESIAHAWHVRMSLTKGWNALQVESGLENPAVLKELSEGPAKMELFADGTEYSSSLEVV